MLYDTIVIGGGPAGVSAAIYCARKKLKTLLITESFGGQSIVSDDIQNWIGEKHISGFDLAKKIEEHVRNFPDVIDIKISEKVTKVTKIKCDEPERICDFNVETDKGQTYLGKTIVVASGARRRKLGVPGEEDYIGKGVSYCSTCDAPLFSNKDVVVVGGGNAGLETILDLLTYATKIYLLERGTVLKGDLVTQEEVKKNPKVDIILNVGVKQIFGDKFVSGLNYENLTTGDETKLDVQGIFVEIGSVPNSEIVKNLVDLDKWGQIIVDAKHLTTSHSGIFAAGDVTDDPYKQNNISVGDGVKAALAAYAYILNREKQTPMAG